MKISQFYADQGVGGSNPALRKIFRAIKIGFKLGLASSVEERSLRKKGFLSSDIVSKPAVRQVFFESRKTRNFILDPEASK